MADEATPLRPEPTGERERDPLLHALAFLSRYYGVPRSVAVLSDGLPLSDGRLALALLPRAAQRAGLSARLVNQQVTRISSLLMPCIVLLKHQRAVVLLSVDSASDKAEVYLPEADGTEMLSLEALQEEASGRVVYLKREHRFDERTRETARLPEGHWFWSTLRLSAPIYRDVFIASILVNLFALASPLFVMNVYDKVVPNLAFNTLWVLASGMAIIVVFDLIVRQVRAWFLDVAGKKSEILVSSKIFAKTMNLRMESRPASVGGYVKHVQEFESIREFFTSLTMTTLIDLPFAIFFLVIVWIVAGPLVLVPIIALIILLGYSIAIQWPLKRSIELGSRLSTERHARLVESVAGMESLKLANAQGETQRAYERAVGEIARWGVRSRNLTTSVNSLTMSISQLATVALILFGVYQISDASLSMGGLIAAVMLTGRALQPLSQTAMLITRLGQTRSAMASLSQIMALPEEVDEQKNYVHRERLNMRIEFDHVGFRYGPDAPEVLSDLSFSINPGERVAIIGRIGAGKSTLHRLMSGLYQATSGSLRIDGLDINQLHPADVRRHIGHAGQDGSLFFGSIRDNIMLGQRYASDEAVQRAATLSGVVEFTRLDPDGMDRQVGEGGRLLSSGQRQAVLLARALLTQPPLLLLDEPTAHMDNRSEFRLKQMLATLPRSQTLILITHKSAMLDLAERVIVLEGGRIMADGPKDEVLNRLNARTAARPDASAPGRQHGA
ncbi:type I secretion system permease/ATPase [Larsenimonas rhizosphaerae]|uniref:Type I secretion system permease/ATPase n=1 Tax=Larsenimonas rhizosphaerae TaxID=2944682 RepID=A0AA41ZDT5_9GAMM|nr:type I secretion system permease/ATPase [Larsenimonas rhizosphaerae]MCM2129926.1 type I secretion system permease/ATPase [Larsenimonas rhizosphaerae]MCX2522625.1 type I secretion system permease/ATPase [Larsenimonas rhizosphaerae]